MPKTNGEFAGGDPNGMPVTISYASPAVSDLPFYAAISDDFFKNRHLKVTMIQMAPNVSIPALSKGEISFSDSPSNTMEGVTRGLPFRVVFSAWTKSPWTLVGKQEYTSVAQLKGKTIGTNQAGSTPYLFLQAALKQAGLSTNDVKIVSSSGTQVTYTALISGQFDAAVLSPPFDAEAQTKGLHEIQFLGDLLALPYVGLGTSTSYLSAHHTEAVATLRAMLDANKWLSTHEDEAASLIEHYSGATPEVAKISAHKMVPLLSQTGEFSTAGIQQALDLQAEVTKTKIDLKPDQVIDYAPLHEAQKEG